MPGGTKYTVDASRLSALVSRIQEDSRNVLEAQDDTTKDAARHKAISTARTLLATLESPQEVVFRQAFESHTHSLCIRLAIDLGIFQDLVQRDGKAVSAVELAQRSGAEEEFVVRIMRMVVANGYAGEDGEASYVATPLSKAIAVPALEACFVHSHEHAAAVNIAMPEYFKKFGYKSPTDPLYGPFQYAMKTDLTYFDFIHSDPRKMKNFNTFMMGNRSARKHWLEWFPVEEQLPADSSTTSEAAVSLKEAQYTAQKSDIKAIDNRNAGKSNGTRLARRRFSSFRNSISSILGLCRPSSNEAGSVQEKEISPVSSAPKLRLPELEYRNMVLVDMGGGNGHDIERFLAKHPETSGRLVLEDLPGTINNLKDLSAGITPVIHDLFAPQPIKGAKFYYTHFLLHDFSDEKARVILSHTRDAMTPGYSRVLLNESVLPARDCPAFFAAGDITMMAVLAALKRTRKQWSNVIESAGLRVVKFWESPDSGDNECVIEAVVA